ncbi:hypothetical protein ABZ990_03080 [Streptomyces sp. NPDC046203]|uniref:hypothetical protein n=1 Tax=Streptomyces sp. NPDC046203 TaxID=3154602 RepID=UPI0033F9AECE
MRRGHRQGRGTVAALAGAAFLLTGCASGQPADTALKASSGSPSSSASPVSSRGTAADPATWTLPLQRYRPTDAQAKTISLAERELVGRCMKEFGVAWKPDAELPKVGPRNMLDWRYGIHDATLSAKRGYQPDAEEQARYEAALRANESRPASSADTQVLLSGTDMPGGPSAKASADVRGGTKNGRRIPPGGCFGQARAALGSATHGITPLVDRLTFDSYPASLKAPEVKAVFARWSQCMAQRGYHYAAPMDADQDPRFRPSRAGVSGQEIATALADITCRDQHRVTRTWFEAESRIQQGYVREHATQLAADRRSLDRVIHTAEDTLAHR